MRTIIMSYGLLFLSFSAFAQEWKADCAYHYLYAKRWDEAIQTYNFSRPFLSEKQPLLMNGLSLSLSYIFRNEKNVKHGINLSYSYFNSLAENKNHINSFNLNFINMGYVLHFENPEKWKGLYANFILSARTSGLFRKLNQEPFEYDDAQSSAWGIGCDLSGKMGFRFFLRHQFHLSPFLLFGYTPFIYSPNTEAVINQTKSLVSQNWTNSLNAQIGISFHFKN